MCCYSSTVNATQGCVTTEVGGATMQGAGYVLKLYRDYMQEYAIQSAVKFDPTFQLDVSVTISGDGKALSVAVVNPSEFAVRLNNAAFTKAQGIAPPAPSRGTITIPIIPSRGTRCICRRKTISPTWWLRP